MSTSFHSPPSLWEATAKSEYRAGELDGVHHTDVAIIGAGFTGLSAALHLRLQGKSVVVLDKGGPGWGASGRNGGQVNPGWKRSRGSIEAAYDAIAAAQILSVCNDACELVFFLIDEHQIDCSPVQNGYIQGANNQAGWRRLQEKYVEDDPAMELLEQADTARLTGAQGYVGALLDKRGGSGQPLDYARGLAMAAAGLDAYIFAPAKAEKIIREGGAWRTETADGVIHSDHLLLCVNGYGDTLQADVSRSVVPVVSCQIASEPLPPELLEKILPEGHHVSETRHIGVYFRRSPDGRFMIGGRGQTMGEQNEAANRAMLKQEAEALYPILKGQPWPHYWHGFVAMTPDSLPNLLDIGPNAYAGLGYNGRGVAMATMMGKILADRVMGKPIPLPMVQPKALPFHRYHNLGTTAYVQWGRMKDKFGR